MPDDRIEPETWTLTRFEPGDWNHLEAEFDIASDGEFSIYLDLRPGDRDDNKWVDITLTAEEARDLTLRLASKLFGVEAPAGK